MTLDPQTAAVLESIELQKIPSLNELPIEVAREAVVASLPQAPKAEVAKVEDRIVEVAGIEHPSLEQFNDEAAFTASEQLALRIYTPFYNQTNDADKPAVHVYFHGGGWLLGNLDTHDEICRELCAAAKVIVVSVDYRLAPEHPFPSALSDAYAALTWVANNLEQLGARKGDNALSVGGDSAGANLAAAVSVLTREQPLANGQTICFQLLCYPVADATMSSKSYQDNAEGYILTKEMMEWFWDNYCPSSEQKNHMLASILNTEDCTQLPPALVITAEYDPLRDEGQLYAERLSNAGVSVESICFDGLVHGFLSQISYIDSAKESLALVTQRLNAAHT